MHYCALCRQLGLQLTVPTGLLLLLLLRLFLLLLLLLRLLLLLHVTEAAVAPLSFTAVASNATLLLRQTQDNRVCNRRMRSARVRTRFCVVQYAQSMRNVSLYAYTRLYYLHTVCVHNIYDDNVNDICTLLHNTLAKMKRSCVIAAFIRCNAALVCTRCQAGTLCAESVSRAFT